jgi:hypothetical protein
MGYIGQPLNAGNLAVQTGTGDGADTTPIATLDYSVGSSESLAIYLDGVKQAVSTYTASGTTLTFTTAPPNGVGIEVVFLALPISLPTPGDNTVGLNQLNTTGTPDGSLFLRDDLVWSGAGGITLGTPVATTSGTAITFGSIPAGTKRITIMFDAVSTSGTSLPTLRLGDAGGIEATGYISAMVGGSSVLQPEIYLTTGFHITNSVAHSAARLLYGVITLTLENSSTFNWTCAGIVTLNNPGTNMVAGKKALSAELTQIAITTAGGTDTFDGGAMNISYE